ncbi:saccharopine dehydrogenase family protein [Ruegeria halocynthiae]|uniref:saccharopine dehydrogenase family protein n=1 Tax=Ruegeria halocynthiae TaxID=985054 RepID=UPI00056B9F92|nr:DUF5938 domain-containing protein [Ruegeria halocynthiae]
MEEKKPVVVYGANGSTGKLICEYLREYDIPFIAAGRNEERLEAAMKLVPGNETADYEVRAVEHSVEALTELFKGASVVCNVVGPFHFYGQPVVEAALAAGCHYIDTTGESNWMKQLKDEFGPKFAAANLSLCPGTAYMYINLEIAAQVALEEDGIDTIEAVTSSNGIPTYGSTQTIVSLVKSESTYYENGQRVDWPVAKVYETVVPGYVMTQLAHPWGGGSLPLWFEDDYRVRNCRTLTTFPDRPMFENIVQLEGHYHKDIKKLPQEEQDAILFQIAEGMQPGHPPRENRLIHSCVDYAIGTGGARQREVILRSGPAYLQTGAYQAAAAHKLINQGPDKVGFVSPCQMLGHRYLLSQTETFFATELEVR